MYLPPHFEETRREELHRIITDHPLGILVVHGPDGLDANHLPFSLHEEGELGRLQSHVARANPVWQTTKDGDEVLVIFRGSDAYVSPQWYPSKQETHRQVPTWNYQVVHAHGNIRIRDDRKFVRGVVALLTKHHEESTQSPRPWHIGESPREYIDQMVDAIVGIEIEITRLVGKSKLSQNREERDRVSAADELAKRGEEELSAAMLQAMSKSS
jgi:transcriptional regulator